ncbi:MAG: amino acid dehydrogenase [Saprospiraceae bacterium]|nr:amino acid dehydrogenase [Saprospiraceae bacterium]
MEQLLEQYKSKKPEIIFEWNDAETDAQGWVVINSLRNGAAGGGTRMRLGLTKDEVVSLAKVMEVKFSVCGPSIGGAKSGINFNPQDPRRNEVLQRWYKVVYPLLKNYYGTGGDLNVDEIKDVAPITEDLGLWHPQEGIVNGHLQVSKGDTINVIGQLRYGCSKIVENSNYAPGGSKLYAVADLITGYGVAESVKHYYDIYHQKTVKGKRVIIQGWGNVASAAGYYLAQQGAVVVGIIDRAGGVVVKNGLTFDEITTLFLRKQGNALTADNLLPFVEANEKIWQVGADIFIPGAASKIVNAAQVATMQSNGLELISCGANVPFVDDDVFFGDTAKKTDDEISLIPDFIANCGMARVFAYLMQPDVPVTDAAVFSDTSLVIKKALKEVYNHNAQPKKISATALGIALQKLLS